jgi:hypothetical protein
MAIERDKPLQKRDKPLHAVTKRDKIGFDYGAMRWTGITMDQIEIWERIYPDVNIAQELKSTMVQWLDRQVLSREPLKISAKGKKRNWKTFITKWLARAQQRAVWL